MPTLNWIGKDAVVDHHRRVPTRLLECDRELSVGDPEVHLFERRHIFSHHAFDLIAEMNGEEAECATRIDGHTNVARWIRNPSTPTQGGYWLPKSPGRFFPDFIVELRNGVIVLVEYKMGKMSSDPEEKHKLAVGELWAERSKGRGRFAWVVDKNWQEIENKLG